MFWNNDMIKVLVNLQVDFGNMYTLILCIEMAFFPFLWGQTIG